MVKKKVELEDKMTAEDFGEFLRNMRDTLGFTQVDMATRLGYNKNLYNAYENGLRLPRKWEEVEKNIRELVKANVKLQREHGKFTSLTESVKSEILELHYENKNTVQIGTRVGVDEFDVEKYLISIGESPIIFSPNFSSIAVEFGMTAAEMEDFDELGEIADPFADEDDIVAPFDLSDEYFAEDPLEISFVDAPLTDDPIGGLV